MISPAVDRCWGGEEQGEESETDIGGGGYMQRAAQTRGGKENEGLHLKRRKEDQAVQILPGPGPLCVCVGLGPAPHYSC